MELADKIMIAIVVVFFITVYLLSIWNKRMSAKIAAELHVSNESYKSHIKNMLEAHLNNQFRNEKFILQMVGYSYKFSHVIVEKVKIDSHMMVESYNCIAIYILDRFTDNDVVDSLAIKRAAHARAYLKEHGYIHPSMIVEASKAEFQYNVPAVLKFTKEYNGITNKPVAHEADKSYGYKRNGNESR